MRILGTILLLYHKVYACARVKEKKGKYPVQLAIHTRIYQRRKSICTSCHTRLPFPPFRRRTLNIITLNFHCLSWILTINHCSSNKFFIDKLRALPLVILKYSNSMKYIYIYTYICAYVCMYIHIASARRTLIVNAQNKF